MEINIILFGLATIGLLPFILIGIFLDWLLYTLNLPVISVYWFDGITFLGKQIFHNQVMVFIIIGLVCFVVEMLLLVFFCKKYFQKIS